jgi:hypothetical protein
MVMGEMEERGGAWGGGRGNEEAKKGERGLTEVMPNCGKPWRPSPDSRLRKHRKQDKQPGNTASY